MSWIHPDGQFDSYILCINGPSLVYLNLSKTETNRTIYNLFANSSYNASISVRSKDLGSVKKSANFLTLILETVFNFTNDELSKLNYSLLPTESLIGLADITKDKIQANNFLLTKEALNKSSILIKEIAETSDNSTVMLKMLEFSDVAFNQSNEYYENEKYLSSRLSLNLELVAGKVDVKNYTNNIYESNYTNFYLKTKNISKQFNLSDLAFNIGD